MQLYYYQFLFVYYYVYGYNISLSVTPEISLEMEVIKKEKKLRIFARAQPGCQITSVDWFHNNHEIHLTSQSKYIQTNMNNYVHDLGILDVSLTDEGEYRAVIKSKPWKTTTKTVIFDMSNGKPYI